MRFEKWQALGNDYVIVTDPIDAADVVRVCDRHTGIGADGVLLVERSDDSGFVARVRIFNPDGSEAELSGSTRIINTPRTGFGSSRRSAVEVSMSRTVKPSDGS